jgi:hypothetical protein
VAAFDFIPLSNPGKDELWQYALKINMRATYPKVLSKQLKTHLIAFHANTREVSNESGWFG